MKIDKPSFWFGVGSGLVTGALLMQLMMPVSTQAELELTDLEKAAARIGYRLTSEQETVQILQETKQLAIYITPDMTLEQIADLLTRSRLIDKPDQFLDALAQMPEESRIQSGYYEFTSIPTTAELIAILTSTIPD